MNWWNKLNKNGYKYHKFIDTNFWLYYTVIKSEGEMSSVDKQKDTAIA